MSRPSRDGRRHRRQRSRQHNMTAHHSNLAGLIMWLPTLDELGTHSTIPEGCYGHPVVILSPKTYLINDVVVLMLTSLGETDILVKFRNNSTLRQAYLPIHPASKHPDTGVQLHLEKDAVLRKKSYVNIREQHTLPFNILRAYDRRDTATRYVLTRNSYEQLVNFAGFVDPVLPPDDSGSPRTSTIDEPPARPVSNADHLPPHPRPSLQRTHSTTSAPPLPNYDNPPTHPPHPATYGTITPPTSYVPTTRPQDRISFANVRTARHPRITGPSSRQYEPLLPRYSTAAPPRASSTGGNGGISVWDRLRALTGQAMRAVRPYIIRVLPYAAVWLMLWLAWLHRATIWQWLLTGLSWGVWQAWELVKGVGRGVVRCVAWLVAELVRRVKEAVGVEGWVGLE